MLVLVLCMLVDVKSLKQLLVESIVLECANILFYLMLSICPYECYTSHISVHGP